MADMIDATTVRMAIIKSNHFRYSDHHGVRFPRSLYVHEYSGRGALAVVTTYAVVISSVGVLLLDYLLTAVLI
ncbi:MAG: hypothetical protein U1F27_03100 [Turneriella sp.]